MKRILINLSIATLIVACGQTPEENTQDTNVATVEQATGSGQEAVNDELSNPNILQVAVGSADHTTLVAAVKAAEQTTALANNGPLTVFAPVNDAFAALPEGTVDNLLLPENKMTLISIIQFHAAPGSYDVDQLKDGQSLFVASGHNIKVEKRDGDTYVHGAKILGTVKASNGIVHVVDKVLLPE
jgi:uncharacterized surface protein with fasciclin (FAS1) repeats